MHIVATENVPRAAHLAFADLGRIKIDDGSEPDALAKAEVLIARTRAVDGQLLQRAFKLRVIARTGAGVDSVDLTEATRRGVPVLYAPDAGTLPMAEGTMALIFATCKRLPELNAVVAEGRWADRYSYDVRDVAGATLGIIGLGRIGSEVARLAQAVGMRVIAHDSKQAQPGSAEWPVAVQRVALKELAREADVITLHCELNETTVGIVDRDLLASVKPGAILINASRGRLIDDDDLLLEALDRGWLSAVGLDVFGSEPPTDGRLMGHRRVVCTPHAVGLTQSWNERVFRSLAADVRRLFDGDGPIHIANPEILETIGAAATGHT